MRTNRLFLSACFLVMLSSAGLAIADEVPVPAAPVAATDASDAYRSPQRVMCEEEMRKDAVWRAELADQLRARIHQEDANLMLANREHVVYAYGALWGITAIFVAFMWVRQQRLNSEIAALRTKVTKAVSDDA